MTNLLTIPANAGRAIVEGAAVLTCPLLGTDAFVRFARDRALDIDRERLLRLERLGLFAPVFRVRTPKKPGAAFLIPLRRGNNWFTKQWAHDTTTIPPSHDVPTHTDRTREGYYSVFQIDHLHFVLTSLTLHVHLDGYLDQKAGAPIDWQACGAHWMDRATAFAAGERDRHHRRAAALLCQHISNRYFPETQTDKRSIQIQRPGSSDSWIIIHAPDWDWDREARRWEPRATEKLFGLTPAKLRNAYEGMAIDQTIVDPIERWYQLTQFVSVRERRKLKGDALRADTMRAGAHMLRLLYRDLYSEELPHPDEVAGSIRDHVPELEVRRDVRRHLEFVANRFGVNPQPKLSLIVEGPSEEAAVTRIFEVYYGAHPGTYGIEIITLGGVGTATGRKKADRFGAIIRLIDYLHHHQTFAFLILDNENYATQLKANAAKAKSIHGRRRYVTRPEYVRIWRDSFEFDNFSCTEIATALTRLAGGVATFTTREVAQAKRKPNSGAELKALYRKKASYGLKKVGLARILVDNMLSPTTRRNIETRPIIKTLNRVELLSARNHLPTTQRTRDANQTSRFLDRTR
ncbi:MAG: hypothetical protein OXF33_03130 [Rhodospirillales bacterium]|nr:hypothetical protein [Rhodospirillales bacterium]